MMRMMRMMMMRRRRRRPRRSRSLIDDDNIWKAQDGNDQPDGGDDRFTKFVSGGDGGLMNADREKSCSKVASIKSGLNQPEMHPTWLARPCHATLACSGRSKWPQSLGRNASAKPWWCSWAMPLDVFISQARVASISLHWPMHPRWPCSWCLSRSRISMLSAFLLQAMFHFCQLLNAK